MGPTVVIRKMMTPLLTDLTEPILLVLNLNNSEVVKIGEAYLLFLIKLSHFKMHVLF